MTDRADREFDVILWGATGFTGQLVAEYLADRYASEELDWAIAGRSRDKLRRLGERLEREAGLDDEIPVVVGNAFDAGSLEAMANRTRVVCSTVGPYAKLGSDLVAACVEQQTDYCDLTGEVTWIHEMVEKHHERAADEQTRIVHCCGFDSIPSDLGTYMLQRAAGERHGEACRVVKFFVLGASGGFSGGTLASLSNELELAAADPEARRTLGHPYSLNPAGEQSGPDGSPQQGPRYDEDIEAWTGPFVMAAINEKVVRRTNALLAYPYGHGFRYSESTRFGAGLGGAVGAAGFSAGVALFTGAMSLEPTRRLLQSVALPDPGEGPSREEIESGFFKTLLVGKGTDAHGEVFRTEWIVSSERDPGYGSTSVMLAESAVCLARGERDEESLKGGILTPASAMGSALADRLNERGIGIEPVSD
jgi:short subunit dehydrogenase-like uncharacterized protein